MGGECPNQWINQLCYHTNPEATYSDEELHTVKRPSIFQPALPTLVTYFSVSPNPIPELSTWRIQGKSCGKNFCFSLFHSIYCIYIFKKDQDVNFFLVSPSNRQNKKKSHNNQQPKVQKKKKKTGVGIGGDTQALRGKRNKS